MEKTKLRSLSPFQLLTKEDGVVLVTALLFMVILTIMGAAAMSIRNTEQTITRNSEIFQSNFYTTEAAALEGVTELENLADDTLYDNAPYSAFPMWLKHSSVGLNFDLVAEWDPASYPVQPGETSLTGGDTKITPPGYAPDGTVNGDRIWYVATSLGRCAADDVSVQFPRTDCYHIHGMYDIKAGSGKAYHGKRLLKIGYKKRLYEVIY